DDVAADDVPDLASISTPVFVAFFELIGARERRLLQIKQIDGDAIDLAEGEIIQRSAIDRLDHAVMRLVRARPARHDDQLVKLAGQVDGDLAMVQAGRIKAATENTDSTRHGFLP